MSQSSRLRPWEELTIVNGEPNAGTECSPHTSAPSPPTQLPALQNIFRRPSDSPPIRLEPQLLTEAQISSLDFTSPKKRKIDRDNTPLYTTNCCASSCTGPECARAREMVRNVRYEISTHERLVHGSSIDDKDVSNLENTIVSVAEAVREAANRLHHSNNELRKLLESNVSMRLLNHSHATSSVNTHSRRASVPSQLELSSTTDQQHASRLSVPQLLSRSPAANFTASHQPSSPPITSTRQAPLSPVSLQIPQIRNSTKPFTVAPSNYSEVAGSEASPTFHATSAHIQDIQHQLSVSQLSHKALKDEYQILMNRLERQRIRSAALERKFEVSDAEIVSLSNENERLEGLVKMLEKQLDDCIKLRDDARRQSSETSSQYLRMIQLAGRLHGSDEESSWAEDRETLTKRILELESQVESKQNDPLYLPTDEVVINEKVAMSPDSRIKLLEAEVRRMKIKNDKLESGIMAARQAAVTLAAQGQQIGTVLSKALEK